MRLALKQLARLVMVIRHGAQHELSVDGQGVHLDIVSKAILVRPGNRNFAPIRLVAACRLSDGVAQQLGLQLGCFGLIGICFIVHKSSS